MRTALFAALLALILAAALGLAGQSRPPAERAADLIRPMPPAWYQALPQDPQQATQAFLARVPSLMRNRGEAVSASRYWALGARVVASLGALLLFLATGAAGALSRGLASGIRREWLRDTAFAAVMLVYLLLCTLPVEVCASYIRYRAFGFSEQPFLGWLQDYFFQWLGSAPFFVIGIVVLMAVIRRRPRSWPLWAGLVYLVLATLYVVVTPTVIAPLTNNYTALPDGETKRAIMRMAHEADISATDVYTSDASRQSRRLNGHVAGAFGSARIVIDDTALGAYPPAIEALAAHEMGHYKLDHPLKMVAVASLVALLGFALIRWLAPWCIARWGGRWRVPSFADTSAIAVLWLLFTAWGFVADPITNAYARIQEAQADRFSLDLARKPDGLAEFMIQDADIARLRPTPLDVILFYDHPSDADRIAHAMRWRAGDLAHQRVR